MKGFLLMEQSVDQVPPRLKYELMSHNVKDDMRAGRRADNYCEARGLNRGEYHGGIKSSDI